MPGDISGLLTAPRDFLKMNLLCMRGVLPLAPGLYNFSFMDMTDAFGASCTRKSKHFWKKDYSIRVWDVRGNSTTAPSTGAFLLPYEPNRIHRAVLPLDAPMMFTAEMTGCTFGVKRYRNGRTEVAHANYQTVDGMLDKTRLAQETAFCDAWVNDHRYRETIKGRAVPDLTRQARLGATIIGVNSVRGWRFYAQQWENLDGTNFLYLDLIEL